MILEGMLPPDLYAPINRIIDLRPETHLLITVAADMEISLVQALSAALEAQGILAAIIVGELEALPISETKYAAILAALEVE